MCEDALVANASPVGARLRATTALTLALLALGMATFVAGGLERGDLVVKALIALVAVWSVVALMWRLDWLKRQPQNDEVD